MASKAVVIFKAIDKLFDKQQNRKKLIREYSDGIKISKDVSYADDKACTLDTYFKPNNGEKYPVMFYIHGGGFTAGDKHYRRAQSLWYAHNGLFVVNANYGLAPEYKFPAPITQLFDALNWICDNAENYNLDLDKIIISGDSAGAYFSGMLAVISTNPSLQERYGVSTKAKLSAAVLNCGIYDLEKALGQKVLFNLAECLLIDLTGCKLANLKEYEYLDVCSSIGYVNEKFPKSFITYAGKDFFCGGQSETLIEKLNKLGVYCESYGSKKFMDNHCYSLGWNTKCAKENNEKTMAFVLKFIKGEI